MNDNNTITTVKKALETSGFTAKMIKKIFAVHEILAKDEDSLQIHDKTSIIDAFAIISSILLMAGSEVK